MWKSDLWSHFDININLLPTSLLSEKKRCRAHGSVQPGSTNGSSSLWWRVRNVLSYANSQVVPWRKNKGVSRIHSTDGQQEGNFWLHQRSFQSCAAIHELSCNYEWFKELLGRLKIPSGKLTETVRSRATSRLSASWVDVGYLQPVHFDCRRETCFQIQ